MELLLRVQLSCFLLSYLVALTAEIARFFGRRTRVVDGTIVVMLAAGLVAHTAYLVARFQASGLPPLVGSSHDWLLVVAWLAAAASLWLQFSTKSYQGLFLLPAVVGLILLAVSVDAGPSDVVRSGAGRWWAIVHAASLAIGIGCIAAASLSALMYLLQYRRLHGRWQWVRRLKLPSLERLFRINYWLVLGSLPLLTVGLFSGFLLADAESGGRTGLWKDPIVWATIGSWAVMSVNLALLFRRKDQTGRLVARRTLQAGICLLLAIFGLTFVTGGIHQGGRADPDVPSSVSDSAGLSEE